MELIHDRLLYFKKFSNSKIMVVIEIAFAVYDLVCKQSELYLEVAIIAFDHY